MSERASNHTKSAFVTKKNWPKLEEK